jgi:hypothetical protein
VERSWGELVAHNAIVMSDQWLVWEGMAKEIAMRGQEDEYFVDAGAALAIKTLCKYDEFAPKATLKIESGSQR